MTGVEAIIDHVCESWFEAFTAKLMVEPATHDGQQILALLRSCIARAPRGDGGHDESDAGGDADGESAWWAELVLKSFEKNTAAVLRLLSSHGSPWLLAMATSLFSRC